MSLRIGWYEVRFGELEDWCINKHTCTKRKKNVMKFEKSDYKKAEEFAKKHNSKTEAVWVF